MMKINLIPAISLVTALFLAGCSDNTSETKKVTTDLVNIPVSANGEENTENLPVFEFESDTWDFGVISQGEKVAYVYKFKNAGKSDLIISSAKGSCGCTVPDYPKKPIPPGGTGVISVEFDSDGKSGMQHKTVTLLANTYPATTILNLKGEIVAPGASK